MGLMIKPEKGIIYQAFQNIYRFSRE